MWQIQKTEQTQNRINPKKFTPRHIIIKCSKTKDKEKTLKAAGQKGHIIYNGTIQMTPDFSSETTEVKKSGTEFFDY